MSAELVGVMQVVNRPWAAEPYASRVPSVRKPGAVPRHGLIQPRHDVILDELNGAAAGEEGVHRVWFLGRDLGQQDMELDVREGDGQVARHLAAALLEASAKPLTDPWPAA